MKSADLRNDRDVEHIDPDPGAGQRRLSPPHCRVLTHKMRSSRPTTSHHCEELQLLAGKRLADNHWCDLRRQESSYGLAQLLDDPRTTVSMAQDLVIGQKNKSTSLLH